MTPWWTSPWSLIGSWQTWWVSESPRSSGQQRAWPYRLGQVSEEKHRHLHSIRGRQGPRNIMTYLLGIFEIRKTASGRECLKIGVLDFSRIGRSMTGKLIYLSLWPSNSTSGNLSYWNHFKCSQKISITVLFIIAKNFKQTPSNVTE